MCSPSGKAFLIGGMLLNDEDIIYGLIIGKYYIYCVSRDEEKYYFEAFLAYLKSKLSIEKSKYKYQIIL